MIFCRFCVSLELTCFFNVVVLRFSDFKDNYGSI